MTAHLSKEQLGLMRAGTMNHYFDAEPQYLDAPLPGTFARLMAALNGWLARRATIAELSALSDAQLADIGVSRFEAPLSYDPSFCARREHDRTIAMLQTGRIAGM